ncbi:MAG TPA: IscS subfamily cysteine desulfurase [Puia sp.]|nr:IscS subfamily cysteine desulfurase [Puia sp.]
MSGLPIYLDYNATTPCDQKVLDAMLPYFTHKFGNAASRSHAYGWEAEEAVKFAREQVAALINAIPEEIVFTSGATESANLALKGVFEMYGAKGKHLIVAATEHKAVMDTALHLERLGAEISWLGVNADGLINLQELEGAIRTDTLLIAVMYANNETGVVQPIRRIGEIAKRHQVLFFSDATQAIGKVSVDVIRDHIDVMAFSAHKIYGPKGVGALYVRRKQPRVRLSAQMDGGGHERGFRSGTLNVPGIVGFGKAAAICLEKMEPEARRQEALRNKLEAGLLNIEGTVLNGGSKSRLPQTINVSFRGIEGNSLIAGINKEIAVSSGSACTSALPEPSHVLKAMGLDDELANSALRFALGRETTEKEIDFVIDRIGSVVKQFREKQLENFNI